VKATARLLQVGDISHFAQEHNIRAERAIRRIKDGQPATMLMKKINPNERALIVECVQHSATLENCLSMGFNVKDVRTCALHIKWCTANVPLFPASALGFSVQEAHVASE
jgi:VPS28 protein